MKIIARLVMVVFAVAVVCVPQPAHADVQDFTIQSFEADYFLTREADGVSAMRVTEKIIATFPNTDQNHGILRAIPQTYKGHGLELKVHRVSSQNGDWQYESYTENNNLVLKIGDPDRYVHNQQTYIIDYTMRGVDSTTYGAQQFYWNVNGTQWAQTFNAVVARVHVPSSLMGQTHADQALCYTGAEGSTAADCRVEQTTHPAETIFTFTTTGSLQPGQTLSVVVPFALQTFTPYAPSVAQILEWVTFGLAILLPPLAAFWFMWRRWRKTGRDPKGKSVIVPEYLPPKELSALAANGVIKESVDGKAVSATIIDLAVRHFIKIYEAQDQKFLHTKTSYDLELIKDPSGLRPEEQKVVHMLFESPMVGQRVAMDALSKTLYVQAHTLGVQVEKQLADQGYFATIPSKAKSPYLVAGIVIFIAGIFFFPISIGVLLASVILMVGSQTMPARTVKGVTARDYLLGLKSYMKLAEAERLKVLQSPRGSLTQKIDIHDGTQLVHLYEKLLPYAMLFGIEKEWAGEFAHLYQQPPDWYSGSSAFNAAYFAGSMHSFNQAVTTSFSPPSSGGSGAGGGGGGGGGGGW